MTTPLQTAADHAAMVAKECSTLPVTLTSIRKMTIALLQHHWADPANHQHLRDNLECYQHGVGDFSVSPTHGVYKTNDARVGVFVGFTGEITSMDGSAIGGATEISQDTVERLRAWRMNATITVSHIFPSDELALMAAESSFIFFGTLAPVFRSFYQDQASINPKTIIPSKVYKTAPTKLFQADLTVSCWFDWDVTLFQESHRWKATTVAAVPVAHLPSL